jgi:uncharacterized 2Fe-2S/4Fe-4S cluster protein (DUF4445 family)
MAGGEPQTTAKVVFRPPGVTVMAEIGANLLDVAWAAGVDIDAPCGGQGRCGRCKVLVESGTVGRRANAKLTPAEETEGFALACQTVVKGAAAVVVPTREEIKQRPRPETAAEKIALPFSCDWRQQPAIRKFRLRIDPPSLADNTNDLDRLRRELARQHGIKNVVVGIGALRTLARALRDADWHVTVTLDMRNWVLDATVPPRLLAVEPGERTSRNFGLAIDIGTTSVVVYLVDFTDGRVADVASAYNSQISCGDDVISRIIYSQRSDGLARLQQLAIGTINDLLHEIAGRNKLELTEINEVTVAGNTTMTHLFLGLDPKYIREEPYIPTVSLPPRVSAGELGVNVNPHASVYCMPSVGSYVGGDTTSGVLSSGLFLSEQLTLFIDVGTNGEIVLGNKDWLVSCACSAGPAFEGGGVGDGMRATTGAVEDVWINRDTYESSFHTIGNRPPLGICGSGLIDLLGEMFITGVIDKSGHIDLSLPTPRVRLGAHGPEYVVAWEPETARGRVIVVTETDIHSLMRAKAAIYAGFSVLCRSVGVRLGDVEQILIGGAFGQYINVEKAIQVGLLPDQPWERFTYLGNTSALGAYTALLCTEMRHEVVKIAGRMTYLELSADNSFMDEYTSALFLPHTDLESFPSVRTLSAERANDTPTKGRAP